MNWSMLFFIVVGFLIIPTNTYSQVLGTRLRVVPKDVIYAVIDSGVDITNQRMKSVLYINEREIAENNLDDDGNGYIDDYIGYNAYLKKGSANDRDGHGTMVTSVVLGLSNRNFPAPKSLESRIKVLPVSWNAFDHGNVKDAEEAMRYVIAFKKLHSDLPMIINASWIVRGYNPGLEELVKEAKDLGILFIVAAGNEGNYQLMEPASYNYDNIIRVGATDGVKLWSGSTKQFDIAARGAKLSAIWLGGSLTPTEGTSFAAPLVGRAAGLLWAKNPHWTYLQVKTTILNSADKNARVLKLFGGPVLNPQKTLR